MEDYVNYLDETLRPLEQKAQEYLLVEEKLRYNDVEKESARHQFLPEDKPGTDTGNSDNTGKEQASAQLQQGIPIVKTTETKESADELKARLSHLKKEIIDMLPEQNKFIPVDLGYGPSSIGAFPNKENPDETDLIIVH